ncbi:MARVEL domain-containing protein [Caenorhabditis elegans]|uniref:MARVEL domain-containing protein n=1 Tax=Caenorhabditis elegans TaxID=6239 RepID=Q9U2S2_CAEEL|nr:MARVEL domain-containing protein [Caenorhabditis elegans]CAB55155.1 MARVEL domain-containing protein [Caenorhabditis elegans]|eukprot:NP_503023.1 Uncharacterized protein CELE_Y116A8C.23 [Caenorhabditis elegans]
MSEEHHDMETAIEDNPIIRRRRGRFENCLSGIEFWCLMITSETALSIYVLIHWLLGCGSHITFSSDDNAAVLSFIYFMSTLLAFLSIMSHVSGLLVPLFLFSGTGSFVLFFLVNISTMHTPHAVNVYKQLCQSNITKIYCEAIVEDKTVTIVKTWMLILFFLITCVTILFQFTRNDEYARRPPPPFHPAFYPYPMPRETPIGATNIDEPPRYSTLEPMSPPKPGSSTVTSPPRYSYWERTFGRARSAASQCSEVSVKSTTAKSH